MKYALLVLDSPASGTANATAARFAHALQARGHQLSCVFFYDAAAETGLSSRVSMQGELDTVQLWRDLAETTGAELVLCIASALRRGVLDANEADRHEKRASTLDPAFTIAGLGRLVEASAEADRLITFGGARA